MAPQNKPMSVARLNDMVLGSVGASIPPSKDMDHVVRLLSTYSGSDKVFQLVEYIAKLSVPVLELRARLQLRAGKAKNAGSPAATSLTKLAGIISDARALSRFWGLLPILQWLVALERTHPRTRKLLTIERLQGLAMLVYYPLEHLSYLSSHSVIHLPPGRSATFSRWSCRAWLAYVLLQFLHIREDARLLATEERSIRRGKKGGEVAFNHEEEADALENVSARWAAIRNEVVLNLSNLPIAVHWSLEKGLLGNALWLDVFGFIAAVTSFRGSWIASHLPKPKA